MFKDKKTTLSKFMSKMLRHTPEEIGLILEPGGWVLVDDLIAGASKVGVNLDWEMIEDIVDTCDKQRFSIDGDKIRANQGHSIDVDMQFRLALPNGPLYHGTVEKFVLLIMKDGLRKMNRQYVHLSTDVETAKKVGSRRGKPVVLKIDACQMFLDGICFNMSTNGVWLVSSVDPKYIKVLNEV